MATLKFLTDNFLRTFESFDRKETARESIKDAFQAFEEAVGEFTNKGAHFKWKCPGSAYVNFVQECAGIAHELVLVWEDGDSIMEECIRHKSLMLIGWDEVYPVKLVDLTIESPPIIEAITQDQISDFIQSVLTNQYTLRMLHRARDHKARKDSKSKQEGSKQ